MTHLHWATLHCIAPACGATFDLHTPLMACPKCGELLEVVVAQALVEVAVSTLGHGLTPLLQPDRAGTAVGNFECSVPIQPGDTGSIG